MAARDPTLGLLALLPPCAFSMYAIFQGAQLVLLPLQMEAFDPAHKGARLAALTTLSSATSVAGLVSGGAVSDATRSRWGRRQPWLAAMGIASAVLLLTVGFAPSLPALMTATAILWFTLNFFQAVLLAIIPDRIAPERRALASWAFGFGGPVGVLIGVNLAAFLSPALSYVVLAALLAITSGMFAVFAAEPSNLDEPTQKKGPAPGGVRALARLGESFRHRDFTLAFAARASAFLAQYMVGGYLLYALQDYLGAANLPRSDAPFAMGLSNTLRTAASVTTLLLVGWALQRTEKRRVFFAGFAAFTALAFVAPALSAERRSWSKTRVV